MATSAIGSGTNSLLDVESIVSSLMQIERRKVTDVDARIKAKDLEISALGGLKAKGASLESALKALETPGAAAARAASSSAADLVTAEATGSAALGDVELKVVSTARSTRVVAEGFASESALVGNGTLTLEVGKYAEAAGVTTFASAASKSITVPAGATLSDLRTLINDADAGMSANIVKTGSTYSLVVTAAETGVDNAIRIAASNPQNLPGGGAPDFTSIAYSAATGESSAATLLQSARNAVVYVDGLRVERASNTIDGAVSGLTFQLRKATSLNDVSEATPVSISVTQKEGSLKTALGSVVSAYNDFLGAYASASASGINQSRRGALNADATVRTMVSRIREALSQGMTYEKSNGNGGVSTQTLSFWQLGVEIQRDGTLKLDETKLATAIADGTADPISKGVTVVGREVLAQEVKFAGGFDLRTDSAKDAQRLLQRRKDEIEDRLKIVESNYRQRYAALDALLSQLNGVNNSVQQVLGQLQSQNND